MFSFLKLYAYPLALLLITGLMYWSFGYDLNRTDSVKLIGLAAALYGLSYQVLKTTSSNFKSNGNKEVFQLLVVAGIVFRVLLFGATPELSQDFYRYLWDGHLLINGINPYIYLPKEIIDQVNPWMPNAALLFEKMGDLSQKHYSNYPPVSQYVYGLAAYIGNKSIAVSVLVFKIVVLVADLLVLFFTTRLLGYFKEPLWKSFFYFLNPLVILELSGNLHLEGVMVAFFLAAIWALVKVSQRQRNSSEAPKTERYYIYKLQSNHSSAGAFKAKLTLSAGSWLFLGGCFLALSIMTKLIPILFIPFLLWPLGVKRFLYLGAWILVFCGLFWGPLMVEGFWSSYAETIGLWFNNFEFNASIYNLIKFISMDLGNSAYKTILTYGKVLPYMIVVWAIVVFYWQWKKMGGLQKAPYASIPNRLKSLYLSNIEDSPDVLKVSISAMLLMFTGHLFIATTVHPWYLCFGVALAIYTPFRYMYLWSAMVFLSYITYANPSFKENLWVISIEYFVVFGFLIREIVKITSSRQESVKNVSLKE